MTFEDAQHYLIGTINETVSRRQPGRLERMRALLRHLGDPQDRYPTVHIGGTSGKGSTCTMAASILRAHGLRTGLHTKPHLRSVTERARVDGVPVSEERFAALFEEMLPAIAAAAAEEGRPSYYETLLALAFLHFARENVDVAVIEVGLGGMLDGTNVLHPEVTAVTNVGYDHMDVLGDTLEEIAADKAGIAKPGIPFVSDVERAEARAVIEARCAEAGAPFLSVRDLAHVEERAGGGRHGRQALVSTPSAAYRVDLPLLGSFQLRNAATAIMTLEQLREELRPSVEAVERGLAEVSLPGRVEFYPSRPVVVFDVAHNPDKARALSSALNEAWPGRRFTFVVGVAAEKDGREMIAVWSELAATFIFTSFEVPGRPATRLQSLQAYAQAAGRASRAIADPVEALAVARRIAEADDVVVVTGSTFVVAELREWWLANVSSASSRSQV
ncbi:MAG TPA: folylpolyglutamate synthase/dihydrofolate synthase family protein [Candidatus Dormibacteraeota bacterium]|nr:folylpolyglutamate synthase/dihydrofolate synthase family protein [Candidatus Dormibacteraeota bacterium]